MEIPMGKVPVERLGQKKGIWDDRLTRSQNHDMLDHPDAVIVAADNFVFDIDYQRSWREVFMSSHDRLRASTAQTSLCGTGDTKMGKFLFEPGSKQVDLGCVPPLANLVKNLVVERPLYLNNLIVTRKLVCNHVQLTLDMARL